jgi:hypothetical protein
MMQALDAVKRRQLLAAGLVRAAMTRVLASSSSEISVGPVIDHAGEILSANDQQVFAPRQSDQTLSRRVTPDGSMSREFPKPI